MLRSRLGVSEVVALTFVILWFVAAIACALLLALAPYLLCLVFFVFAFALWHESREVARLVERGQWETAGAKARFWGSLGLFLAGVLPGVALLVVDRQFAGAGDRPPSGSPLESPRVPSAALAGLSPACPRCGRPVVWVARHGRWYCSAEKSYL
jgi:hypothetical protein